MPQAGPQAPPAVSALSNTGSAWAKTSVWRRSEEKRRLAALGAGLALTIAALGGGGVWLVRSMAREALVAEEAASRAVGPPGEAVEDWEILVNLGKSLGLAVPFSSAADVRQALAAAMPGTPYADAERPVFTRPVPAKNWLQASNPSERWKWDFLYQDLPPIKGHNVQMEGMPPQAGYIPLKPV